MQTERKTIQVLEVLKDDCEEFYEESKHKYKQLYALLEAVAIFLKPYKFKGQNEIVLEMIVLCSESIDKLVNLNEGLYTKINELEKNSETL